MTDTPGWASPSSSSDDAPEQAAPQEPGGPATGKSAESPGEPAGPGDSGRSGAQGEGGERGAAGSEPPPSTPPNWSKQQPPPADWTTPAWSGQAPGGPPGGRQQTPGWGHPPAARPGIIPLRPLGVGEILDGAVSAMRAHWRTVLGVSLVVALITQTVSTAVAWWMFNGVDSEIRTLGSGPPPSLSEMVNAFSAVAAGIGATETITVLGTLVVTAILTMVVSRSVLGRPVTTADAWRDARPRLPKLLGLTLLLPLIGAAVIATACAPGLLALAVGAEALAATLLVLGVIAGACVAIWLLVRLSLSSPALMLEKQGVFKAMARSVRLVRGSWWRIFGILLLTAIITMIISGIVQTPFTILSVLVGEGSVGSFLTGESSGDVALPALVVTGVGAAIGMTISFPISAGVTALLYVDQRIRREALDLDLARAAGVPGYEAPTAGAPTAPSAGN